MADPGSESALYQQLLLEHYRRPKNRGRLAAPTHRGQATNPLCGDDVEVECALRGELIADIAFDGRACSVSQASASLMTEAVRGCSPEAAMSLGDAFAARLRGEAPDGAVPLGALEGLLPVARFAARITCALLPWKALIAALNIEHRTSNIE